MKLDPKLNPRSIEAFSKLALKVRLPEQEGSGEGSGLESWLYETSKMFNCSNKYNRTGNSSWKWLALGRTLNDERLKSVKLLPRRFNVSREEILKNSYVNVPLNLYLIDTHGLFVMDWSKMV